MILGKDPKDPTLPTTQTSSKRRRDRRKKKKLEQKTSTEINNSSNTALNKGTETLSQASGFNDNNLSKSNNSTQENSTTNMSSKESPKSREEVMAAREAKKLAKLKGKSETKPTVSKETTPAKSDKENISEKAAIKGKDEVDKAVIVQTVIKDLADTSKEKIKAERAAKKLAKQAKKKGASDAENTEKSTSEKPAAELVTHKSVVDTITNIVDIAKEVQEITAKVNAFLMTERAKVVQEPEESVGKSKSELKAERRAKQEAQRAAKQAQVQAAIKPEPVDKVAAVQDKEKSEKPKQSESKSKSKSQVERRAGWFQHLHAEPAAALQHVPLNSNVHPAIVKLGVQLATGVITGANARCIALLDALKKMVADYRVPARTEAGRALAAALTAGAAAATRARPASASQDNALKYLAHQLAQLPHDATEADAKKMVQEEIDRYIREQIDMAGEAISLAVRGKICAGDTILTYGCSSLILRILSEAWSGGVQFQCVVAGARSGPAAAAREMARRLLATGLPTTYIDITAISYYMNTVSKVVLGCSALLANGAVLGAAGGAAAALAARERNVPVLVCCETHKFSGRVQTDAFLYNELGDPDDLIDKTDESSPLKDWRSNPNLTPLNLTYDVIPASLVTAVVTELAILPCTSAPVVLRFKLSEYGI